MSVRFRVITLLCLSFLAHDAQVAVAQQSGAQDLVYQAARNRLGLLTYCWGNGLIDPQTGYKAIQLSTKDLAKLGAKASPAVRQLGDEAEREGGAGIVGPNGKRSIDGFARSFRTTPAALCKEWVAEQLRGQDAKRVYAAGPGPVKDVAAELAPAPPPPPPAPRATPVKRWETPAMSAYGCRPEEWWLGEQ